MFAKVSSIGLFGLNAFSVEVETSIERGAPKFEMVGLPTTAVTESKERVRTAIKNSGMRFPASRITVNLAPGNIKKQGPVYDLPILVSLIVASGQLQCELSDCAFIGELSLDGRLCRINGCLSMVIHAKENGIKKIFIPKENASEACVVDGIEIYAVENVNELVSHFNGYSLLSPVCSEDYYNDEVGTGDSFVPDFADVKGQLEARRALEIAAAGGHNVLMVGPPGSGKSMLAKRIPSILPSMTFEESIDTTKLYSIAGQLNSNEPLVSKRPFRAPHSTISNAGLTGGGSMPVPGEISLAHNGVLFLDELPEFPKVSLEALRQPLEESKITISRATMSVTYPCDIMFVAAMNPCPCGYFGSSSKPCTCPKGAPQKYLSKISGPLLDRLDIHIEVPAVDFKKLSDEEPGEKSESIRKRVEAARLIQQKRFADSSTACNAKMTAAQTRLFCILDDQAKAMLERAFDAMGLSARAYDKILRIARTIADLDNGSEKIQRRHIAEALQYRNLDRKYWRS